MKAAEYPFRPGAIKIIILVTDNSRVNHSSLTNETVAEALNNISARLVVIGKFPFKRAIAVDTFGHLYTKKNRVDKVTKWSDKLPQYDEYVQVLTKTQGVVIKLKAFESGKTDRVFQSIVERMREDKCDQECTCVTDEVGKGKTICKTVPSCN
ncbi:hypothetical protein OS493_032181 [Desmophyllum pertusum]|uniref:Uncharacterized protein n=1 Tax=Desmophyllum pertusum TaxID=174260 RepID=A0A9X0D767_9CNID|nr:hypothetical protein OS493_032181 [Desmophyllum pertusum]